MSDMRGGVLQQVEGPAERLRQPHFGLLAAPLVLDGEDAESATALSLFVYTILHRSGHGRSGWSERQFSFSNM